MSQVGQIKGQSKNIWLTTLQHISKFIFFNDKSIVWIFLNKTITKKILLFYALLLFLPIKSITTGEIYFLNIGFIIEGLILSFFYYVILYLMIPIKRIYLGGLLRVFLSIEVINIFMLISLCLNKYGLVVLYSIVIGWYFTLSVYSIYRIMKITYKRAIFIVSIAFLLTNFIPMMFNN
jgi:hypothetical protein